LPNIKVLRGSAELIEISDNFYKITPPPMPQGWKWRFSFGPVNRLAEVHLNTAEKTADIKLDSKVFDDKNILEGSKIFMCFHEIGHLIHGPNEAACDRFAFYNSLRAGVSPYICYVTMRQFMPEHYQYRVNEMFKNLAINSHLKNDLENE
jgi:hypothetical protein